eukprot:COSAG01_NODE_2373_length_7809_cov_20.194034_6_plen_352_part_00
MATQPPLRSGQPAAIAAAAAAVNQLAAAQSKPSDITPTTTKRAARPAFSPLMGMTHAQRKPEPTSPSKLLLPAIYPGFGPASLAAAFVVNKMAVERTKKPTPAAPTAAPTATTTSFMAGLAAAAAAAEAAKKRAEGVAAARRATAAPVPTSTLGFSGASVAAAAAAAGQIAAEYTPTRRTTPPPAQVSPWKAFAGAAAVINKLAAERTATALKAQKAQQALVAPPPLLWAPGVGYSLSQASREAGKAAAKQPEPLDPMLYLRWAGFNPMMSTTAAKASAARRQQPAEQLQPAEAVPPSSARAAARPEQQQEQDQPKVRALGTQKLREVRSLSMTSSWECLGSTDSEGAPAA